MASKIASLLIEIGMKVDGALRVEGNLKSLRDAAGRVGDAADTGAGVAGRAFATLGRGLVSVGKFAWSAAQAIGGAARSVYGFVKGQTDAIGATVRMSRSLGLNVVEFQRLAHAAKFSGVSDDSLASGMKRLNATLFDLEHSTGGVKGKGASAALKEIGLSLKDLQGKSRTEQLGIIADHLNKIHDGAQRSAIAAKLFGKTAGPEMMGLLAKGSEGINKLAGDAHVFTEEQAAQAAAFNRSIKEISEDVQVLVRDVALDLLPVVKDVIDSVKGWIGTNRELAHQKTHEALKLVTDAVQKVWDNIKIAISAVQGLDERFGILHKTLWLVVKVFEAMALGIQTNLNFIRALTDSTYTLRDALKATKEGYQDLRNSKEGAERREKRDSAEQVANVTAGLEKNKAETAKAFALAAAAKKEDAERKERRRQEKRGEYAEENGKKKPEKHGLTLEEIVHKLQVGDTSVLSQRLGDLGKGGNLFHAEDIKPTVAVTYNTYQATSNATFNISEASNGNEVANVVAARMKSENTKAAASLAAQVKR